MFGEGVLVVLVLDFSAIDLKVSFEDIFDAKEVIKHVQLNCVPIWLKFLFTLDVLTQLVYTQFIFISIIV